MLKKSEPQSLETYLAQIAHELRALPSQARADEMREIEAHLRTMIEARGDVAGVLAQFGKPRKVGRDLRRAWERKQPEAWWRALIAPLAGVAFFAVLSLVMQAAAAFLTATRFLRIIESGGGDLLMFWIFFLPGAGLLITGFVMGYLSPKRGRLIFLLLVAVFSTIAMWPIDITKIDYKGLSDSLLYYYMFGLLGLLAVLIGIHFGARFSRKRIIAKTP